LVEQDSLPKLTTFFNFHSLCGFGDSNWFKFNFPFFITFLNKKKDFCPSMQVRLIYVIIVFLFLVSISFFSKIFLLFFRSKRYFLNASSTTNFVKEIKFLKILSVYFL
jgi:hypothetical protein